MALSYRKKDGFLKASAKWDRTKMIEMLQADGINVDPTMEAWFFKMREIYNKTGQQPSVLEICDIFKIEDEIFWQYFGRENLDTTLAMYAGLPKP